MGKIREELYRVFTTIGSNPTEVAIKMGYLPPRNREINTEDEKVQTDYIHGQIKGAIDLGLLPPDDHPVMMLRKKMFPKSISETPKE